MNEAKRKKTYECVCALELSTGDAKIHIRATTCRAVPRLLEHKVTGLQ